MITDTTLASTADTPTNSLTALENRVRQLEEKLKCGVPDCNSLNLLIFDAARDRLLAAFVLANGAAACGMQTTMFFSFWATSALRKEQTTSSSKSLVERAFGWLLPRSAGHTRLSQLDMCGMGRMLMRREMKKKNIADLDELIETAAELNVAIRVCEMSMRLMGIQQDELIEYPNLDVCGAASFIDDAASANTTLFL